MTQTAPLHDTTGPGPAEPDPTVISDAVGRCVSVASLHAGPVASYLPGKRVNGVTVDAHTVSLHVDLAYPSTVSDLRTEVLAAVRPLLFGRALEVTVEDVILPAPTPAEPSPATPAEPAPAVTTTLPASLTTGAQS